MTLASILTAVEHSEFARELPFSPWIFGLIALALFAVLGFITWTYRDVANRHIHRPSPDAAAHAGAPGASSHGSGHPGSH